MFCGKVGTGFNEKLLQSLYKQFQDIIQKDCPFANLPEKRSSRYGAAHDRMQAIIDAVYDGELKIDWRKDEVAVLFKR